MAGRRSVTQLAAYYWEGSASRPHPIRNISADGALLDADMVLYPGTVMNLSLQRLSGSGRETAAFPVRAKVVRRATDGMAVRFLYVDAEERKACERYLQIVSLDPVRAMVRGQSGQSLIEFALVLPLLMLLIVNVVNFAGLFYAWITISNSVRAGAEYMIQAGATVGGPAPASTAQVAALVTQDCAALPNAGSLQVRVCSNKGGVVSCSGTGSGAVPADPEAPLFVSGSVDVTYTYQPFVPLWSFPALGVSATLPPTVLHRQARMRMMQ